MWKAKTLKNKVVAVTLIICGILSLTFDTDATATVMILLFAIPLFFAKENWIM